MGKQNFKEFKKKLNSVGEWPRVYLFKFIIPADNRKLAKVEALFGTEARVQIRPSKKGNYLSISAKELMLSADGIIDRYEKASEIEGLMAL